MRIIFFLKILIFSTAVLAADFPTSDQQQHFQNMSVVQQQAFLQKRSEIVQQTKKILQKLKPVFYVVDVLKSQAKDIQSLLVSQNEEPSDEIKEIIRIDQLNHPEKYQSSTMKVRVQSLVEGLINSIENQLWNQSELVARANEFSFLASASLQLEAGHKQKETQKGWGGLFEIGFSLGYNTDKKSVFFQLFHAKESFKSTVMKAVFIASMTPKAGLQIANRSDANQTHQMNAETFYPPMVPGFQMTSKESYAFGISSGIGFPPSPFGDLLTYTNSRVQKNIVRVDYSPMLERKLNIELVFRQKLQLCQQLF